MEPTRRSQRKRKSALEDVRVGRGLKRLDREDLKDEDLNCISLGFPSAIHCGGCTLWKRTARGQADKEGKVTDRAKSNVCHRLWLEEAKLKKKNVRATKRDHIAAQINFVEQYVIKPVSETLDVESDAKEVDDGE